MFNAGPAELASLFHSPCESYPFHLSWLTSEPWRNKTGRARVNEVKRVVQEYEKAGDYNDRREFMCNKEINATEIQEELREIFKPIEILTCKI